MEDYDTQSDSGTPSVYRIVYRHSGINYWNDYGIRREYYSSEITHCHAHSRRNNVLRHCRGLSSPEKEYPVYFAHHHCLNLAIALPAWY